MFLTKYFGDKVFFKHFALVLSQPWRAIKNGEQIIILISVKLNKTDIDIRDDIVYRSLIINRC